MPEEREIIRRLESDIRQYDQIFLVTGEEVLLREIVSSLCCLRESGDSDRRRLVLIPSDTGPEDIWDLLSEDKTDSRVSWRRVSRGEAQTLCRLYDSYEFSDRFHILSREEQYGGLLNFVDTGILSAEELLEALLH